MDQQFFVSVLTEQHMPVLQRFLMILKRKSFRLEKIWVSETKTTGLYSISASVSGPAAKLENLCALIEKQIDVLAVHGFAGQLHPETVFISGKQNGHELHPASFTPVVSGSTLGAEVSGMLSRFLNEEFVR